MSDSPDTGPSREEVLGAVAGQIYPANLATLLERAHANGAEAAVLEVLERLPDLDYNGPTAVRRALIELDESEEGDGEEGDV